MSENDWNEIRAELARLVKADLDARLAGIKREIIEELRRELNYEGNDGGVA
jgi:hypothetical protein